MVNSISAFKKGVTSVARNLYLREYPVFQINDAWRVYLKIHGVANFSKNNLRHLNEWFQRMMSWACRPVPRKRRRNNNCEEGTITGRSTNEATVDTIIGERDPLAIIEQEPEIDQTQFVEEGGNGEEEIEAPKLIRFTQANPQLIPYDPNGGKFWTEQYIAQYDRILQETLTEEIEDQATFYRYVADMANMCQRLYRNQPTPTPLIENGAELQQVPLNNCKVYCEHCWTRYNKMCKHERDQCERTQFLRAKVLQIHRVKLQQH